MSKREPRRWGVVALTLAIGIPLALLALNALLMFFPNVGNETERWLSRFDSAIWIENKMESGRSPRTKMVRSLMRRLEVGTPRVVVEELIGPADYERNGWQVYSLGYPRSPFAFDYDVFEVRYDEKDELTETRVRST